MRINTWNFRRRWRKPHVADHDSATEVSLLDHRQFLKGVFATGAVGLRSFGFSEQRSGSGLAPSTTALPLQHAAPFGDDGANGTSWETAKLTILAAYDALPNDGGTILVAQGTEMGREVDGQGLWLVGPHDPNWNSPPRGWRKAKRLVLRGVAGNVAITNSPGMPQVQVQAGSATDRSKPAMWLAAISAPISVENITLGYPAVALRLGIGSDVSSPGSAMIWFKNVGCAVNQVPGNGPTVEIGANSFWLWFEHCAFIANAAEPLDSDRRAAVLVQPAGGASSGLIQVTDCNFSGGNFKYYVGITTWGFAIRDCVFESDFVHAVPPPVHVLGANTYGNALIENVSTADAPGTETDVKIEGPVTAESVVCINVGRVSGPATVISRYAANWSSLTSSPVTQSQVGFWQGRVVAQHDSARRAFAPVAVRFPNLAPQDPVSWIGIGPVTVTTGVPAPDGSLGAGRLSTDADGRQALDIAHLRRTFTIGDFIIVGTWARGAAAGFRGEGVGIAALSPPAVTFQRGNNYLVLRAPLQGDGEWEWLWDIDKITQVDGSSTPVELVFSLLCDNTHPQDFYLPMLLHIPAGQLSDNEAHEMAQHLTAWPDGVQAGAIALARGQDLALMGPLMALGGGTTASAGPSAGSGGTASIVGGDLAGTISVTTTAGIAGVLATVTFARPYASTPRVLLTAASADAASTAAGVFVTADQNGFSINAARSDSGPVKLEWNYLVLQ